MILYLTMLLRLLAAVILGGIVGFERAEHGREAGIRTHIMVCLGAAAIMVVSEYIVEKSGVKADIMRMGAQVVSGIGFLGVGCIITNGDRIKGLTTAAGLWTTACVGIAVGSGYYAIAASVVGLMILTLLGLKPLVKRIYLKSKNMALAIQIAQRERIDDIIRVLDKRNIAVGSIRIEDKKDNLCVILSLECLKSVHENQLISELISLAGVEDISVLKDV